MHGSWLYLSWEGKLIKVPTAAIFGNKLHSSKYEYENIKDGLN